MEAVKTKVLIIDEAISFGGSIEVAATISRYIDNSKYQIIFVTCANIDQVKSRFHHSVEVVYVKKKIDYVNSMHFKKKIRNISHIIKKLLIYMYSLWSLIINAPYYVNVIKLAISNKVSIIHTNNGSFGPILSRLLRIPCVYHIHGSGKIRKSNYVNLLSRVDRFIAISNFTRRGLISSGVEEEKIASISNATDVDIRRDFDKSAFKMKYGIRDSEKVIGCFGRIIGWKGQREFLKAMIESNRHYDNFKIILVGDKADMGSTYFDEVSSLAKNSCLSDKVIFTGYQNNVSDFYAITDVVVHASTLPEPFGLVVIEAMAHECPVIVSDLGAPPEIIENGITGYVVSPFDTLAMSQRVLELLNDDVKRIAMGRRGRQLVEGHYSPVLQARKIEALYEELIVSK